MHEEHHTPRAPKLVSYLTGFALSILFTIVAFGLTHLHLQAEHQFISLDLLVPTITMLAVVQLFVQAVFFLHLTHRTEGRLNFVTFVFTIYTVAFIVIGSLWIMRNLDANMSPQQIDAYLHKEN
jgi:cytochrome o ubiquinol oxidase subunit IV